MASCLLIVGAFLSVADKWPAAAKGPDVFIIVAEALVNRALAGESPEAGSSGGRAGLTQGMSKEAVRQAWGAPENVRKIRTCFGWQEEWVYRGQGEHAGAAESVLLFDEGEVLVEIK